MAQRRVPTSLVAGLSGSRCKVCVDPEAGHDQVNGTFNDKSRNGVVKHTSTGLVRAMRRELDCLDSNEGSDIN